MGDFSGKYTTTYTKVLGGRWLRQTYNFPPGQFGGVAGQVLADTLVGYDEENSQWVRFFATSHGDYFAIRMKDTPNGWAYNYVNFFHNRADSGKADATFTKESDTAYTIEGPTYPEGGKTVTEHHSCRKQ